MDYVNNNNHFLKDAALEYAARGIRIMPLLPNSDTVIPELYYDDAATTDLSQIESWWNENPEYNIGVEIDFGYLVIELSVDPLNKDIDGSKALAEFEKKRGLLPPTLSMTDDHGHRWLFYNGVDYLGPDFDPYPGVTILTRGIFVPLPPSVIGQYPLRWETQLSFKDISEVNERVFEFLEPPDEKGIKTPMECFRHKVTTDPMSLPIDYAVPKGERHAFLYENLKYMYDKGLGYTYAIRNVLDLNYLYCDPRLSNDGLEWDLDRAWIDFRRGRGEYYVGQ